MFEADGFHMSGDHLDVSFRRTDEWSPSPLRSIRSAAIRIGDAEVGPSVLLGAVTPLPEEPLDWTHGIDPMHFHGSDQFRLVVDGDWVTARDPLTSGQFGFQEAGRVYQEHPANEAPSWLVLVYGDRRGEPATLTLEADRRALQNAAEIAGSALSTGGAYPHPAGPKGAPAVRTTAGGPIRGQRRSSFGDSDGWRELEDGVGVFAGMWGDSAAGPMVLLVRAGAGEAVPEATYSSEVLLVVANGSCRIGDAEYQAGDLRVQQANAPLASLVAGVDGVQLAIMLADRRAAVDVAAESVEWVQLLKTLYVELTPA
jgi:hypothetical protein